MTKHTKFKTVAAPSCVRCRCGWITTLASEKLAKAMLSLHMRNCTKPVSTEYTEFINRTSWNPTLSIPKEYLRTTTTNEFNLSQSF
jgi:hypothetical protein